MKKAVLLFVICLNSFLAFAQLPDVEVKDIDQNWISLSELNGEKYTVVDFWATWCKPCVTAIPKLNSIYDAFSGMGVQFVGINVDGPRNQSKVKPFARSLNVKYPIVLDPDQDLVDEFNVTAFPTLIVLNKKGKEVFTHEGFNPGDEKLIQKELSKLIEDETEN
jgi:thiol-disulfide isomerase/thioredoxin